MARRDGEVFGNVQQRRAVERELGTVRKEISTMGREARNNPNPFAKMKRVDQVGGPDRHTVYDSLGRVVDYGDMVLFAGYPSLRWRVASIKPVLRPDVPPGMVEVTFTAIIQQGVQGGSANPELIKIADYAEMHDYTAEKAMAMRAAGGIPPTDPKMGDSEAGAQDPAPNTEEPPPPPAPLLIIPGS